RPEDTRRPGIAARPRAARRALAARSTDGTVCGHRTRSRPRSPRGTGRSLARSRSRRAHPARGSRPSRRVPGEARGAVESLPATSRPTAQQLPMRPLTLGLFLPAVLPSLARSQSLSSGNSIIPPGSCPYLGFARFTLGPSHVMNVLFLELSSLCPAFPALGG